MIIVSQVGGDRRELTDESFFRRQNLSEVASVQVFVLIGLFYLAAEICGECE